MAQASDGYVQVAPDGAGKSVDASVVTTGIGTVERQRVAIGDGSDGGSIAKVGTDGLVVINYPALELLQEMLAQQRITNLILMQAFGITEDINQLRASDELNPR